MGEYGQLKDLATFFSAPCLVEVRFYARTGRFLSRLRILMGLTVALFFVCEIFRGYYMTEVYLYVISALDSHIGTRFSYQLYNYLEKCTMHFVVNYITVKLKCCMHDVMEYILLFFISKNKFLNDRPNVRKKLLYIYKKTKLK